MHNIIICAQIFTRMFWSILGMIVHGLETGDGYVNH